MQSFRRRSRRAQIAIVLLAALPIAVLLVWLVFGRQGDDIFDEVHRRGALYVGIEGDNPPFSLLENDRLAGLDADLARALAEALGVEVHFVVMGYDGLYDALAVGRVDVLISALRVDPDWWEDFRYSVPYFDAGQVLVVPDGSGIAGPADLEGRAVAVEFGSEGDVWAREQQRRLKELHIQPYDAPVAALDALADGKADAAIIDSISARLYGRAGIEAVTTVSAEPYAVVTRVESAHLRAALDAALQAMIEDGRLDALIARWF
ncbi:MAG: amino acid ABC transporter substrate-binding protein [Anaerolineae bacterium]|nr:amino acid ABC transporter substrate-binding protein [Anaerolineae bacterium]